MKCSRVVSARRPASGVHAPWSRGLAVDRTDRFVLGPSTGLPHPLAHRCTRAHIYLSSFVAAAAAGRGGGGRCSTWPPPVQEANRPCLLPAADPCGSLPRSEHQVWTLRVELPHAPGKSRNRQTVNPLPYAEPLHQIRRRTRILDYSTPDPPSRPPGGLEPARGPPSWGVVK